MPFWRRRRDEPPVPEVDEPVDPALVDPDWEPDPADFGDLDDGTPVEPIPATDPLLPFDAEPASMMTIQIPAPVPVAPPPSPAWAEPVHEPAADAGGRARGRPRTDPRQLHVSVCAGSSGRGPARGRRGTRSRRRSSPATSGPPWPSTSSSAPASDTTRAARKRPSAPSSPRCSCRATSPGARARRSPAVRRSCSWSGVNGTGKTTTIGKLASRYAGEGRSVILAAADTFRAAAIDQLRIWADRAEVPMIAHAPGADPGAVVYDALDAAVARGADLVIADTAGRLHTRSNLMDELAKIRRIVDKRLPGAEPETIFVLDATTGQNGLAQAKAFHEAVGLTGIVLTKLDSTAKGGIVFAIEDALERPGPLRRGGGGGRRPHPVRPRRVRGGALRVAPARVLAGSRLMRLAAGPSRSRRRSRTDPPRPVARRRPGPAGR